MTNIVCGFLTLIIICVSLYQSSVALKKVCQNQLNKQFSENVTLVAKNLTIYINNYVKMTEMLAKSYNNLSESDIENHMKNLYAEDSSYTTFFSCKDGDILSTDPSLVDNIETFDLSCADDGKSECANYMTKPEGSKYYIVTAPVYNNKGVFGVLGCAYRTDLLGEILKNNVFSNDDYTAIFSSSGELIEKTSQAVITNTEEHNIFAANSLIFQKPYSAENFENAIKSKKSGYIEYSLNDKAKLCAYYVPININNWFIITSVPQKSYNLLLNNVLTIQNTTTVVILLSLSLVFIFILINIYYRSKELVEINESLKISEEKFKRVISVTTNFVFEFDNKKKTGSFFGPTGHELNNKNLTVTEIIQMIYPEDRYIISALKNAFTENISEKIELTFRMKGLHGGTTYRWYDFSGSVVEGESTNMIALLRDVNEKQVETEQLRIMAETDLMSGLLNRNSFEIQIEALLNKIKSEEKASFILIDIDDFKSINDTYGHNCGDLAIIKLANELKKMFRDTDLVARIGGDEFVVWLKYTDDKELIKSKINLLNAILSTANENSALPAFSVCAGVSFAHKGDSFHCLYTHADIALYKSKNNKDVQISFWENGEINE